MRLTLRSEKLSPFLQYQRFIFLNDPGNLPQIVRPESMIDREPRGRQPEFRIFTSFCNVNVRRLTAVLGVEIKLVAVDSQYRGHGGLLTNSANGGKRLLNPLHNLVFAQYFEQMIQARAVGIAGDGEARRVDEHAGFHAELLGGFFQRGLN